MLVTWKDKFQNLLLQFRAITRNKKLDYIFWNWSCFFFQCKENTRMKTGPRTEGRMLKSLRNANMIKSYRHTKSSGRYKRNDVSEQLASSIHCLFYSLNTSRSAAAKRNGKKKATRRKTGRKWKARGKYRACNLLFKEHSNDN